MNKQEALEKVAEDIRKCQICKVGKSGLAVPGEGNANAEIVFLGEAPGRQEAATGRPFIGRSGQLLRRLIKETGLTEDGVFITSPVKYLPDRGTPSTADILHGKTHLDKQLEIIDPKIIVLMGRVATAATISKPISVVKQHGEIIEEKSRRYFITLHPAAALRFVKLKKLLTEDFLRLKESLSLI